MTANPCATNQIASWPFPPLARESIATRRPVKGQAQNLKTPGVVAPGAEIARYYDLDVVEEHADIDMYLALAAASDGPILELACGSGRICVPLASAGHDVTGVDIDADMLSRAQGAWAGAVSDGSGVGSLTLRQADASSLALNQTFDLVILAFNSILLIGEGDASRQKAALSAMARHLSADGRAVIDTWLPSADDLELYDGRLIHEWTHRDADTGESVSKSTSATFDLATRRAIIDTFFDASQEGGPQRRTSRRDVVHFPTRAELLDMIESAGLAPQIVAGDYAMSPVEDDSERVIVVAAPS